MIVTNAVDWITGRWNYANIIAACSLKIRGASHSRRHLFKEVKITVSYGNVLCFLKNGCRKCLYYV